MKVVTVHDRCVGNGICEGIHPTVFEVGDDGGVVIHNERIREQDRELVIHAVDSCPAQAIRLVP